MEYEDGVVEPIMGDLLRHTFKDGVMFNYFERKNY